jgi:hypothetical protein
MSKFRKDRKSCVPTIIGKVAIITEPVVAVTPVDEDSHQ